MRKLACLALFALSFGGVAHWLSGKTPNPRLEEVTSKLTYFARNRDDFDLVAFGSSRTYRGLVPAEVDAELARQGLAVRSFNFGLPGMEAHEISATLRRALAVRPKKLRWVLIEVEDWSGRLEPRNEFKGRTIRWHDRHETLSVLRTISLADLPFATRLRQAWVNVLHGVAYATAAGQGPAIVRQRLGQSGVPKAALARLATNRGWEPFVVRPGRDDLRDNNRRNFLADLPGYQRRLRSLPRRLKKPADLAHYPVAAIAEQVATVRAAGFEPIYFIPPTLATNAEVRALAAQGVIPHLLAFNDPKAYPELYAVKVHWDAEHLTPPGAELFSRALAEQLAPLLAGQPAGTTAAPSSP